jgi:hypothetical protein
MAWSNQSDFSELLCSLEDDVLDFYQFRNTSIRCRLGTVNGLPPLFFVQKTDFQELVDFGNSMLMSQRV